METIPELRDKLQRMKVEGRERPWGYRLLQRGPSIYITRALLRTSITANQTTLLAITFGLIGCAGVFYLDNAAKIIGLAFLYGSILFDKVDGEIARYRKVFSLRGIYLDEIYHLAIPPLFFMALTFGLGIYTAVSYQMLVFFGGFAALSMPLIRIGHSIAPQIFAKKYMKHPELFTLPTPSEETKVEHLKKSHTIIYRIAQTIHQFQEFFAVLVVFTITLSWEFLLQRDYIFYPITSWVLVLYGVLLPIIFIENTWKGIHAVEKRIASLALYLKTPDRQESAENVGQ